MWVAPRRISAVRHAKKQLTKGACPNRNCLFPEPCKNMVADHRDYVKLLRELKRHSGREEGVYPLRHPF